MTSRKEAIKEMLHQAVIDTDSVELTISKGCFRRAILDMQKLEKIEQIIANKDKLITEIYGVAIPEGFTDLFEMIEQIVKGVEE